MSRHAHCACHSLLPHAPTPAATKKKHNGQEKKTTKTKQNKKTKKKNGKKKTKKNGQEKIDKKIKRKKTPLFFSFQRKMCIGSVTEKKALLF
jgi:uncharacterized FlaG/YvyC family protein